LRICTHAENCRNRGIRKDNKSGCKGIYFNKRIKKWHVRIGMSHKRIHLGFFTNFEKAYNIYCDALKKYHGEYGRLK